MMALQKGILEQSDITGMLKDFKLIESVDGLLVENPPTFQLENEQERTEKEDA
jgi:hypothetical protein